MRSRYAAFALGLGGYLIDSLAKDHPDRAGARDDIVRAASSARGKKRFLGLTILDATTNGDAGEVLFVARIFERGRDESFAELSTFRREGGGFRYANGVILERARLPEDARALTRDAFLRLAAANGADGGTSDPSHPTSAASRAPPVR